MKKIFALFLLLHLFFHGYSQPSSKNEEPKTPQIIPVNEVLIVFSKVNLDKKAEKKFPLHDTVRLPLISATISSGSCISLNLEFKENEGGRVNAFEVFFPAAPKLQWDSNLGGDFTLKNTLLPYTLKGDDYAPFKNTISAAEIYASASIRSAITSPLDPDLMYFRYEEITITAMDFKNEKANIEMNMKLISEKKSDIIYGSYSAEVHLVIKDFGFSIMMVD